jgi:hypothetical protein
VLLDDVGDVRLVAKPELVLDGVTDGVSEGIGLADCNVPMTLMLVDVAAACDCVRVDGMGLLDVSAAMGASNEPDMPERLQIGDKLEVVFREGGSGLT